MSIPSDLHELFLLLASVENNEELASKLIETSAGITSSKCLEYVTSQIEALCNYFSSVESCEKLIHSLNCQPDDTSNICLEVITLLNVFNILCRVCMNSCELGV